MSMRNKLDLIKRIAHGLLTSSLLSQLLGIHLPGKDPFTWSKLLNLQHQFYRRYNYSNGYSTRIYDGKESFEIVNRVS